MDDQTRAYYVEKPIAQGDTSLTLYGTFIDTSRKLANLRENARITNLTASPIYTEATFDNKRASVEQQV